MCCVGGTFWSVGGKPIGGDDITGQQATVPSRAYSSSLIISVILFLFPMVFIASSLPCYFLLCLSPFLLHCPFYSSVFFPAMTPLFSTSPLLLFSFLKAITLFCLVSSIVIYIYIYPLLPQTQVLWSLETCGLEDSHQFVGVQATTGTTVSSTFHIFSDYFSNFLCCFFLMLQSHGIASAITMTLLTCLYPLTFLFSIQSEDAGLCVILLPCLVFGAFLMTS